eukprot:IDg20817t1
MCTEQWRGGVKLEPPARRIRPSAPSLPVPMQALQPGAWIADCVAHAASRPRTA